MPPKVVALFMGGDQVGRTAKARLDETKRAADILRHALRILAQGGPQKPRHDDTATAARIARFEGAFETEVDWAFFDAAFWDHVAEENDLAHHLTPWRARLRGFAEEALRTAEGALPRSELRRVRAVVRARSVFHGRMRRFIDPDAMFAKENGHAG